MNGASIGQRERDQSPADADRAAFPERDLRPGDEVRVGGTVLRVGVEDAARPTVLDATGDYIPLVVACAGCGCDLSAGVS